MPPIVDLDWRPRKSSVLWCLDLTQGTEVHSVTVWFMWEGGERSLCVKVLSNQGGDRETSGRGKPSGRRRKASGRRQVGTGGAVEFGGQEPLYL